MVWRAGERVGGKLQHAITNHVERHERGRLHSIITALADDDPRKVAWLSCDDVSNRWVSSWPTHELELSDAEFGEVFTTYLGRESPAVRPYSGQTVANGPVRARLVIDPHGMRLNLANIPGGGWTQCHNALGSHVFNLTAEAGFHTETTPAHIFTSLVPVAALLAPGGTPGIVPDASVDVPMPKACTRRGAGRTTRREAARRHLCDIKVIFGGGYATIYLCARARSEQTGAVAEREHRVNGEYKTHARRLDAAHSSPGTEPILQRLQSFGPVRGLAAGQYSEVSPDVHSLIQVCAESLANKNWRALGARSAHEARGFVVAAVKRRLGLMLAREMARHRLRRVPAIGVPNAALSGPARFQRAMDRRHGIDEPLDRPPAFVPEEFFAFQALAAQPAD